ncbi:MAG: hypothetical protein IH958_03210, partial [Chloroflexi bacterium]|nr:hypothetical protein [Chloroflexota bacterium]
MNKRRLLLVAVTAVVVALLAFAGGPASPRTVSAAGPGMSLAGPATVVVGETFTITVSANPAPDVEIMGFASEVVFPDGVSWLPRARCEVELQVARLDGGPILQCFAFRSALLEGAAHAIIAGSGGLPLPPLDVAPGETSPLLEIDLRCDSPGQHELVLTAVPESPFGALFADVRANELRVKTIAFDMDGDTSPEQIADVLTVDCQPCPDCPKTLPPPEAILDVETTCLPEVIRPNEDAVLSCEVTITNSGDATAIFRRLGRTTPSGPGGVEFSPFSRVVDGNFLSESLPLPNVPAHGELVVHTRDIVNAAVEGTYSGQVGLVSGLGFVASAPFGFEVANSAADPPLNLAISRVRLTPDDPSNPPDAIEFELTVMNQSDVTMTNVTFLSRHVAGNVIVSATEPPADEVDLFTSIVRWEIGSLEPGEGVRVRETITSAPPLGCADSLESLIVIAQPADAAEEKYAERSTETVRVGGGCGPAPVPRPGGDSGGGDSGGGSTDTALLAYIGAPQGGTGPAA